MQLPAIHQPEEIRGVLPRDPELYATHEYIANRISRVTSKEVYAFFKAVLANSDPGYEKIANIADKYVTAYDKQKNSK